MESLIIGIAGGSGSGKSTFTNRRSSPLSRQLLPQTGWNPF